MNIFERIGFCKPSMIHNSIETEKPLKFLIPSESKVGDMEVIMSHLSLIR